MEWFKSKGIKSGDPSSLVESLPKLNLRHVNSATENGLPASSSLLQRRLKSKLTLL